MHVEVMDKLQFYYDTTIYDDDFQDYISRKANIAPQDQVWIEDLDALFSSSSCRSFLIKPIRVWLWTRFSLVRRMEPKIEKEIKGKKAGFLCSPIRIQK